MALKVSMALCQYVAVLSTWFWDLMVVLVFNLKSAGLLKLQKNG